MITIPLRIRYGRVVPRKADAWLIPGNDCRAWLAELLQWEAPLAGIQLYCVPRSSSDLAAQGILAIPPEGSHPRVSSHCHAYARIGRKGNRVSVVLCLPVDARIDPDVTDEEILDLLGSEENVYLWHPACGLVGFEQNDRQSVADFLEGPSEQKTSWDMAKTGIHINQHLTAILPKWTPAAENVLTGGQEDIGSRSSALKELPRSPDEAPESLLARMATAIKQKLTDLLQKPNREQEQSEPVEVKQSSGKTAASTGGLSGENPGGLTSVEYAMGNAPQELDSQPSTRKKVTIGSGKFAAGLLGAMAGMGLAAGRGLAGLMKQLKKMGEWIGDKMQSSGRVAGHPPQRRSRIDEKLLEKRHRETLRLLHMLETDPDKGLRYALPFSKGGHRGAAAPGSHLISHDTDFNLSRLGGGQPADLWDLPYPFRERIIAKYHELASRELQLGRYHRAAYIYAELLGNLDLAASALKAGKHWREAAVLYRERLHRDDEAARCLEEGGLWTEAIALYEELNDFEKVGDLYRQLEQEENAQRSYRAAVGKLVAENDYLAAARLLENKLLVPDEALVQLEAGWAFSIQARVCLEENFLLLARLGRHEAAAAKIDQLCRESWPSPQEWLLIDILSSIATTYPDAVVGSSAADATRIFVGARLREASGEEKPRLLEALRRLVPGDRLLSRDCQRYLHPRLPPVVASTRPATPKPRSAAVSSPSLRLEPIKTIILSEKVEWRTAVSVGSVFYATGYEGKRLIVEQGFWDGTHTRLQTRQWEGLTPSKQPIMLTPARGGDSLMICLVGGPPLPQQFFPSTDELPERVSVGTPSWIPPDSIAIQRTSDGVTHVVQQQAEGLVLYLLNVDGRPLNSCHLPLSELRDGFQREIPVIPMPLHARSDATYLAYVDRLVVAKPRKRLEIVELPNVILSLEGSCPFSRTRLVAAMEEGAILYWIDSGGRRASFATDLVRPVVRFTRGGWLVAASAAACQVYRTEGHRIRLQAECPGGKVEPLAVLDMADPNRFALFGMDGAIRLYQMPHR